MFGHQAEKKADVIERDSVQTSQCGLVCDRTLLLRISGVKSWSMVGPYCVIWRWRQYNIFMPIPAMVDFVDMTTYYVWFNGLRITRKAMAAIWMIFLHLRRALETQEVTKGKKDYRRDYTGGNSVAI